MLFPQKKVFFPDEARNTIKSITNELEQLDRVKSINSILNVPLLQSSKKPLADILEGVPLLEDNIVDLSEAKKEFLSNSSLYKNNLVSNDFKTTAILVNLKDNQQLNSVRQQLNY